MVRICWASSKRETKLYSTPVNEERCEDIVIVCVSCWVVRSKTQSPRREIERKKNNMNARRCSESGRPTRSLEAVGGVAFGERDQSTRTTGSCGKGQLVNLRAPGGVYIPGWQAERRSPRGLGALDPSPSLGFLPMIPLPKSSKTLQYHPTDH